jgi:hypothetical protein
VTSPGDLRLDLFNHLQWYTGWKIACHAPINYLT